MESVGAHIPSSGRGIRDPMSIQGDDALRTFFHTILVVAQVCTETPSDYRFWDN